MRRTNSQSTQPGFYTPTFWLGFTYNFFMGFVFSNNMIYPLFVKYEGGSPNTIGLFMAVFFISSLFCRPFIGSLVDRYGSKFVMMLGTLCLTLPCIGFYLLLNQGMHPLVWPLRFIQGLGWGMHITAFLTMAADMAPEGRKNESISMYSMSGLASNAIGPFLGERFAIDFGMGSFFLLMIILGGAAFVLASLVRLPRQAVQSPWLNLNAIKSVTFSIPFQILFLVAMAFSASYATITSFLAPIMEERGVANFSLFFTGFAISGISIRLLGSHWGDRYGFITILGPALSFYGLGLVILQFSNLLFGVLAAGLVCGIAHGLAFPLITSLSHELSPRDTQGTSISLTTGMMDLSNVITSSALGWMSSLYGYSYLFIAGSFAPFLGAAMAILASSILTTRQEEAA